jgi:pSer/pThr/pTyr-binding forkhead associated (FHA) protein
MNFCKMCGMRLGADGTGRAPSPGGASPAALPALPGVSPAQQGPPAARDRATCPACGGQTPANYAFCQHCGHRLPTRPPEPAPAKAGDPIAATVAQVMPTPPAGLPPAPALAPPRPQAHPSAPASDGSHRPGTAPRFGASVSVDAPTALSAEFSAPPIPSTPVPATARARPNAATPQSLPAPARLVRAPEQQIAAVAPPPLVAAPYTPPAAPSESAQKQRGRLVFVRPDGSDGQACTFEGHALDLGRSEGSMRFEQDPYLAPRHARIERQGASFFLYPLDWINGVYLRVREPCELSDSDVFLIGRQVLRFELPLHAEREARAAVEHGVAVFGSPLRPAWGRLRQLTVAALTLDIYYLSRGEVILGREDGQVRFPEDEHMSRRHAALHEQGGRVTLSDLGSSNGTYLRLRAPRELASGDLFRLGDQLLRFESQ